MCPGRMLTCHCAPFRTPMWKIAWSCGSRGSIGGPSMVQFHGPSSASSGSGSDCGGGPPDELPSSLLSQWVSELSSGGCGGCVARTVAADLALGWVVCSAARRCSYRSLSSVSCLLPGCVPGALRVCMGAPASGSCACCSGGGGGGGGGGGAPPCCCWCASGVATPAGCPPCCVGCMSPWPPCLLSGGQGAVCVRSAHGLLWLACWWMLVLVVARLAAVAYFCVC